LSSEQNRTVSRVLSGAYVIEAEVEQMRRGRDRIRHFGRLEKGFRHQHAQRKGGLEITLMDVAFRYGTPPGETQMRAIGSVREVYGIRRIAFNEKERTSHRQSRWPHGWKRCDFNTLPSLSPVETTQPNVLGTSRFLALVADHLVKGYTGLHTYLKPPVS
jgi:hypothetical protein